MVARYSEEELFTPMMQQQTPFKDPNLADFYTRMGERTLENAKDVASKQVEASRIANQATIDANEKLFGALGNAPRAFLESKQQKQDIELKRAAAEREKAQSEESLAGARQTREFGAQMQPAALKQAQAGGRLTETQAAGAEAEQRIAQAPATGPGALPGETNQQYNARSQQAITKLNQENIALQNAGMTTENSQKIARNQREIEAHKQNIAATRAGIAATEVGTKVAQAGLTANENAARIAALSARLQVAKNDAESAAILAQMDKEGITPGQKAQALQAAKTAGTSQKVIEQALAAGNPETQRTYKAMDDAETYVRTSAALKSALDKFKSSPTFGDADKVSLEKISETLRASGKPAAADRIVKMVDVLSGMNQVTRSARATVVIGDVIEELATDLDERNKVNQNDPKIQKAVEMLRSTRNEVSGLSPAGRNLTNPFSNPSAPVQGAPVNMPVVPAGAMPRTQQKVGKR
jgi:hypothetical protein